MHILERQLHKFIKWWKCHTDPLELIAIHRLEARELGPYLTSIEAWELALEHYTDAAEVAYLKTYIKGFGKFVNEDVKKFRVADHYWYLLDIHWGMYGVHVINNNNVIAPIWFFERWMTKFDGNRYIYFLPDCTLITGDKLRQYCLTNASYFAYKLSLFGNLSYEQITTCHEFMDWQIIRDRLKVRLKAESAFYDTGYGVAEVPSLTRLTLVEINALQVYIELQQVVNTDNTLDDGGGNMRW